MFLSTTGVKFLFSSGEVGWKGWGTVVPYNGLARVVPVSEESEVVGF